MIVVSLAIVYFGFLGMGLIANSDLVPEERIPVLEIVQASGRETATFFANLAQGDLGTVPTVSGERSVSEILFFSYRNSLGLLLMALALAAVIGLLAGAIAALTRSRRREYSLLTLTIIGISAPSFLVAVLLQQAGIKYTVTFGRRLVSMGGFGWDFAHLIMPLLVLAARPVAYITRATFINLSRIMDQDYIRTAFAKGLSLSRTVLVHAFRNLAVPVFTAIGVSLRFSLSTLPIVEYIFAWPGMGLRILEGINDRVPLQVVTIALAIGLTIQLTSLFLDFSYRFLDPRIGETA